MKRKVLFLLMSVFFAACSVDNEEILLEDELLTSLNAQATVNNDNLCNPEIFIELCTDEIDNPTLQGFTNFYKNQVYLHTQLPHSGQFSPSMAALLEEYREAGGIGTFTSTYTVTSNSCVVATAEIAVEVTDCTVDTSPCVEDIFEELCSSEIDNVSLNNFTNYFRSLIFINTSETSITGSFSPTLTELYEQFQQEGRIGTFASNYTFDDSSCGTTTLEVAVEVTNCAVDTPPCVDDIFVELCSSQIENATLQGFRDYYRNQIFINTNETTITGTFSPTLAELHEQFQQEGRLGTFATDYTFVDANCGQVTIEVAVEVLNCPADTPPCVEDIFVELCSSQIDNNATLQDFRNFYRNQIFLNTNETSITGTFRPTLSELYEQFHQEGPIGTFSTNYTANIQDCGEVTFEVTAQVSDCN